MHPKNLAPSTPVRQASVALLLIATSIVGCSSSSGDDDDTGQGGASGSSLGGANFGGFSTFGGSATLGGFSTFGGSGPSSSGSTGSSGSKNGGSGNGGATSAGGVPSAGGGGVPSAGAAGGISPTIPPPARADGKSPYLAECHGDTRTCVDVVNLTCLGIKDPAVRGYSCSSSCQTDSDCSMAPSGAPAMAACVDFAVSKHCLFVCLAKGEMRACPTGMSCYVYPGSATGYCLWPP